jgi:hypothetical protein
MPGRKKPTEATATVEKPVEAQEVRQEVQPTAAAQPATPPTTPTEGEFTIKEVTWEEFEKFAPSPRREKPKSKLRQAFELAASGKVIKLEGLTPAQVRAVLAVISMWNMREKGVTGKAPVQVKYDIKAGVVYLAPAEKQ